MFSDENEAFITVDSNMQGLYENVIESSTRTVGVLKMHQLEYKAAHEPYYYSAFDHYGAEEQMKELPAFRNQNVNVKNEFII